MACFYGRRWHRRMTARDTRKRKSGIAAKAINKLSVVSIAAMQAVKIRTELPRLPKVVRMWFPDVQTRQFAFASAFALQAAHMLTAELHHMAMMCVRSGWVGGASYWSVFVIHMVRRRHTEKATCMTRTSSNSPRLCCWCSTFACPCLPNKGRSDVCRAHASRGDRVAD